MDYINNYIYRATSFYYINKRKKHPVKIDNKKQELSFFDYLFNWSKDNFFEELEKSILDFIDYNERIGQERRELYELLDTSIIIMEIIDKIDKTIEDLHYYDDKYIEGIVEDLGEIYNKNFTMLSNGKKIVNNKLILSFIENKKSSLLRDLKRVDDQIGLLLNSTPMIYE